MKRISFLGSTGSVGRHALEVVAHLGEGFGVSALAAKENIDLLEVQARAFRPEVIAVFDEAKARELKGRLPGFRVVGGMEGLCEAAIVGDMVLSAMSGTMGLRPTLAAIRAGKDVALANKETLVSGGDFVLGEVERFGVKLLPVDSEHSALFQCLVGEDRHEVSRLILTASGGPFRETPLSELERMGAKEALSHPTWQMGPKITVDSSTLMNKGLEMIEAHHLFGLPVEKIEVIVHPQSIIHSLVEFQDGSMKAQASKPDMKLPIQYAFTYPKRRVGMMKPFDFISAGKLEFYQADTSKFRCLALAYWALKQGGTLPGFMNAANEVLVERFLRREIRWVDIATKLEILMEKHRKVPTLDLETILEVDLLAKKEAAYV